MSSLALIANPGFYCNDELVKSEHIVMHGFDNYLFAYVNLRPNPDFPFAVRPVAFLVEGYMSLFLVDYPFLVHLADVLMHWLAAALLFLAVSRYSGQRQLAWVSAIVFLLNPLGVYALGWSGALMDRLFVIFGLMAFLAAHEFILERRGYVALLGVFLSSALSLLSKETALALPAALAIYWFLPMEKMNRRRIWMSFGACVAPMLLFVLSRLPYLLGAFGGKIAPAYAPSLGHAPGGLFGYFLYPFLPFVDEAHYWAVQYASTLIMALTGALALCYLLWGNYSFRALLAYLFGYGLFLAPVAMLPLMGSHYLYGSGIAFSIALAASLLAKSTKINLYIAIALTAVAIFHTYRVHHYFYERGLCMSRLIPSLQTAYFNDGKPEQMNILTAPDAPARILNLYAHGRSNLGVPHSAVELKITEFKQGRADSSAYLFDCDCLVRRKSEQKLKVEGWGPYDTTVGQIANPQSDGTGAFWILIDKPLDFGETEVLLDGKPALETSTQPDVITAKFAPEIYNRAGEFKLEFRQVSTGKIFQVGTFNVKLP